MSAAANWSYTAKATIWRATGRDDKTGKLTFALPEVIACDYGEGKEQRSDNVGVEFVGRINIYTEYSLAKRGDYIAIGEESIADPIAANAVMVRSVTRYADTFDRKADDYEIAAWQPAS